MVYEDGASGGEVDMLRLKFEWFDLVNVNVPGDELCKLGSPRLQ